MTKFRVTRIWEIEADSRLEGLVNTENVKCDHDRIELINEDGQTEAELRMNQVIDEIKERLKTHEKARRINW